MGVPTAGCGSGKITYSLGSVSFDLSESGFGSGPQDPPPDPCVFLIPISQVEMLRLRGAHEIVQLAWQANGVNLGSRHWRGCCRQEGTEEGCSHELSVELSQ